MKDLYIESYKTYIKEIEKDRLMERIVFSINDVGKTGICMQKNEIGPLS